MVHTGGSSRWLAAAVVVMGLVFAGPPAQAAGGHVIRYHGYHYVVSKKTATKYLKGASKSFKTYAAKKGAALLAQTKQDGMDSTCPGYSGIHVDRFHTRGFAAGFMSSDCDGGMTVWKSGAKHWKVVQSTQEFWICTTLSKAKVPDSVLGPKPTCWNDAKQKMVAYHHR